MLGRCQCILVVISVLFQVSRYLDVSCFHVFNVLHIAFMFSEDRTSSDYTVPSTVLNTRFSKMTDWKLVVAFWQKTFQFLRCKSPMFLVASS